VALLICPDCKNEISENAHICIHCGCPRHILQPHKEGGGSACFITDSYQKYRRPLLQITLIGIVFSVVVAIILNSSAIDYSGPVWLFILYVNFFVAFWITYFTSRKPIMGHENNLNALQSLRRLLDQTATHWPSTNEDATQDKQQLVESFRKKSNSSIQMLSIMIAVSILILDRVTTIIDGIRVPGAEEVTNFRLLLLALTGIMAVVSFVCFVISVDALDVVFNKFRSVRTGQTIIRHYYQSTINPKYYGLLSMLVGVICLSAYYHYYIGSLTIGITLYVGYFHWFPNFKNDVETKEDKAVNWKRVLYRLERLILIAIVVLPFILWLNDRIL